MSHLQIVSLFLCLGIAAGGLAPSLPAYSQDQGQAQDGEIPAELAPEDQIVLLQEEMRAWEDNLRNSCVIGGLNAEIKTQKDINLCRDTYTRNIQRLKAGIEQLERSAGQDSKGFWIKNR